MSRLKLYIYIVLFSVTYSYVQALCHYLASADDQLSLQKGNVLHVVNHVDEDWLMCRHGDEEGKVHTACVKRIDQPRNVDT